MLAFIVAVIFLVIANRLVLALCTSLAVIMAMTIGIVLALRVRHLEPIIVAMRDERSAFDRKPTRAERRVIAASLRLAMTRTELRSLFPIVADRAEKIAMMITP